MILKTKTLEYESDVIDYPFIDKIINKEVSKGYELTGNILKINNNRANEYNVLTTLVFTKKY